MKKALALLGSILLIGLTSAYADTVTTTSATPVVAVVNVQQIFQESPKIADLNKKLKNQFQSRQEKLISAQKNLQDEVEKFKKDSTTMSQKDKDNLQKKIVDDQSTLSKDANSFQQDLNKEQNKIMKSVLSQLNEIISGVAKKNNYTLVLDSQAVVYAADSSDITKQVSTAFNK